MKRPGNGMIALLLVSLVAGMTGLAFASVPLYRIFCQVTGYGGTPRIGALPAAPAAAAGHTITVRFDANVNGSLPWDFRPGQRQVTVALGQSTLTHYRARNLSDAPTVGTATFNVTPHKAAQYFAKIQCFCFTEQPLGPGEQADMGVSFYVDPAILEDPNARDVGTITLSYTFFRAETETAQPVEQGGGHES